MRYIVIGPTLREAEGHAFNLPRGASIRAMSVGHAVLGGLDGVGGDVTVIPMARCALHSACGHLDVLLRRLEAKGVTLDRSA